jgi:uncharacterized protein RhaS with RHS repeats
MDPIGLAGGLNLYQYTMANPIRSRDPSGTTAIVLDRDASATQRIKEAEQMARSAAHACFTCEEFDNLQRNREHIVFACVAWNKHPSTGKNV